MRSSASLIFHAAAKSPRRIASIHPSLMFDDHHPDQLSLNRLDILFSFYNVRERTERTKLQAYSAKLPSSK
jgi:hypothetical protein